MNKLKSGILLAYAILAMSAPAVLAAQPADADNQTAGAALVNMDSPNCLLYTSDAADEL